MAAEPEGDDVTTMAPPLVVRAAAGGAAFSGVLTIILGVQLFFVWLPRAYALLPWGVIGIGALVIVCAVPAARARLWGVIAAEVALGVELLVLSAWLVRSFSVGIYSCFAVVAVPFAAIALVAGIFALAPARRASAARARLRARGETFGM